MSVASIDQIALDAAHKIEDALLAAYLGRAQRTSRIQIIVREAIEANMTAILALDMGLLIATAKEFVEKVDRGEAKSTDTYNKFKHALRIK